MPAIPLLMGNWWTVASFVQVPEAISGTSRSSEKKAGTAATSFGSL